MPLPPLPNIDDVRPVDDTDQACFDAVRRVLEEHGALSRFGLTLLHSHFDVAAAEVLVERVDSETRTLTIRPIDIDAAANAVETSWRLDDPSGQQRCETRCQPERNFQGQPYHNRPHYTVG